MKKKDDFEIFNESGFKHKKSSIRELGRCKACGRPLTDPISAIRGYGPECYRRIQGDDNEWDL